VTTISWLAQKRRVERLTARVEDLVEEERRRRSMIGTWSRRFTMRYRTVFWAGVTGFVFLSRRRREGENDRHNVLVDLGLAAWVVRRWRKLPTRVEAGIDRAREQLRASGHPRPAPANAPER
jgi:Txe/YoeB family toxin of Txe-Axe toxin-antitoxin module